MAKCVEPNKGRRDKEKETMTFAAKKNTVYKI